MKKLFLMSTLFVAIAFLFGCGKYNLEDAKAKLEEEGYVVVMVSEDQLAEYQEEDDTVTGALTAQKSLNNVTILTFKSAKDAKAYAEDAKKESNPLVTIYIEVSGNAVIAGTNEAMVKDLK